MKKTLSVLLAFATLVFIVPTLSSCQSSDKDRTDSGHSDAVPETYLTATQADFDMFGTQFHEIAKMPEKYRAEKQYQNVLINMLISQLNYFNSEMPVWHDVWEDPDPLKVYRQYCPDGIEKRYSSYYIFPTTEVEALAEQYFGYKDSLSGSFYRFSVDGSPVPDTREVGPDDNIFYVFYEYEGNMYFSWPDSAPLLCSSFVNFAIRDYTLLNDGRYLLTCTVCSYLDPDFDVNFEFPESLGTYEITAGLHMVNGMKTWTVYSMSKSAEPEILSEDEIRDIAEEYLLSHGWSTLPDDMGLFVSETQDRFLVNIKRNIVEGDHSWWTTDGTLSVSKDGSMVVQIF